MTLGWIIALVITIAALAMAGAVANDPYLLVRAEFQRERISAGLAVAEVNTAGHRWIYAYADDAPANAHIDGPLW